MAVSRHVSDYMKAWRDYDTARVEVTRWGTLFSEVGETLLKSPHQLTFSSIGSPTNLEASPDSLVVAPGNWTTPKEIGKVLRKMHLAQRRLAAAWRLIPIRERPGLIPPPEGSGGESSPAFS